MRGRGRPRHPDVLTPRQWEVLGLVQEGLTNEEIAERLGITERGAKFHVSEILGKLGIANRYEAASWQPAEAAAARAQRPWALALAPFGALRRLHWNAAAQVAAVAGTLVVAAGIAALAWGLVRTYDSSGGSGSPAVVADTPTALPTALPGEAPMPQHVSFAPGETIAADGKAGVFFLDPYTGAAEGWVVPAAVPSGSDFATDRSFAIGGVSSDGSRVVYECQYYPANAPVPCGDDPSVHQWYVFDTTSGARTRLAKFTGQFVTVSPDGKTLLGVTTDGLAVAPVESPDKTEPVAMPAGAGAALYADWSPDSDRVVVLTGTAGIPTTGTYLVDVSARRGTKLDVDNPFVDWNTDGSRMALASATGAPTLPTPLVVMDRDGQRLWSRMIDTFSPNPRWSADGTLLSVQIEEPSGEPSGARIDRLEIYDGTTGETRYRVQGAIACQGPIWVGDSHRLLSEFYFNAPAGSALIDLDASTITRLSDYLTPMPFDSTHAINADGHGWTMVDLASDTGTAIADTTVNPTWDPLHANQPLFAGKRLFFTAQHGGHGGCAEGASPSNPPQLKLEVGPFADDAPVTRGP